MSFLKQSKNRTFNYQPRFSKESQEVSSGQSSAKRDFISQWNENRKPNRKIKGMLSLPVALFLLVILLIGMYVLNTYIE